MQNICDKCNGVKTITIAGRAYSCPLCVGTGFTLPFYAGIGSRETPAAVGAIMGNLAVMLAMKGYALRSGGAPQPTKSAPDTVSADQAFESGCDIVNGRKIIRTSTLSQPAMQHAAQYCPHWDNCTQYVKSLHARNSLIVCGDDLAHPVDFVVCWTKGGAVTGGTGQGLRVATAHNIPIFNLAICSMTDVLQFVDGAQNVK